jgi:hypothetical protein
MSVRTAAVEDLGKLLRDPATDPPDVLYQKI